MPKAKSPHSAGEFGKSSASASVVGVDAPIMGAPSLIIVDGIVERESGVTPPPPPVSVKAIVIALSAMFLIGLLVALLWVGTGHRLAGTPEELPYMPPESSFH